MGTCFLLPSFLVLRYGKTQPADEFNAVSYEKTKSLCFLCFISLFFCSRVMHDYFIFYREGVQTHKARRRIIVNPAYSQAVDVRLHDISILFALLFNFFKRERSICDVK